MVWGRSHAARKAPDIDLAIEDAPLPRTAQCARCETPVVLAGGKLPASWSEIDGQAVCPDCTPQALSEAEREAAERRRGAALHSVPSRLKLIRIGAKASSYNGCRVGHEFAHGFVGLRIHAGAAGRPNRRDDPVNFMLDRHGLDELIRHLCDIRKELPSQDVRGTSTTAARERKGGLNG